MKRLLKGMLRLITGLAALAIVAGVATAGVFAWKGYNMYCDAVEQTPISEKVASIQSMDGYVHFDELPDIYIEAVISVEDKRFFSHGGIDPIAIMRAAWNDIRTMSFVEGGSTITQQITKNEYFTQEKKMERKFAEVFVAFDLEAAYTKEEIFEMYVNTIYFGSGYYGIRAAAEGYYGCEPSELTDYQAVMLAGLPNAPSSYSLDVNPELASQRMGQVLDRMVECDRITREEADALLDEGP